MSTRTEHDFIGELNIPNNLYYGVQTSRAINNFHISTRTLENYPFFIKALAQIKKSCRFS